MAPTPSNAKISPRACRRPPPSQEHKLTARIDHKGCLQISYRIPVRVHLVEVGAEECGFVIQRILQRGQPLQAVLGIEGVACPVQSHNNVGPQGCRIGSPCRPGVGRVEGNAYIDRQRHEKTAHKAFAQVAARNFHGSGRGACCRANGFQHLEKYPVFIQQRDILTLNKTLNFPLSGRQRLVCPQLQP